MLRIEKRVGALESGLEADVVIVEGNPIENIRTLLDPLLVISNGRIGLDRLSFAKYQLAGSREPGAGTGSREQEQS
jgi:hypothetical protein